MIDSRITPASMTALVAHYARIQGLTGRAKPGTDWTFAVDVVAGLKDPRSGGDAWAVVVPKPNANSEGGSARVRVRDIDATPIPGFDGDAMLEIKVTVSHELFHCIVAEATRGGALTIPAEEMIVEAAAQAVVRSEGTTDARVMARSIAAIPDAVRARVAKKISASAGQRARGGMMNPEMVMKALNALEGGDAAAALEILKGLIAAAAGGGAAPPSEPAGTAAPIEAREENADMDPTKKPGATPAGPPAARPMARVDQDTRARKAADSLNVSAIRARIHTARLVDGIDISPALEKEILAETDIDAAEKLLRVVVLAKGDGSRARTETGGKPVGAPPPHAPKKYDADKLVSEGIHPTMAKLIADETNEDAADLSYKAARARIVSSTSPWPTRKPAGGVS